MSDTGRPGGYPDVTFMQKKKKKKKLETRQFVMLFSNTETTFYKIFYVGLGVIICYWEHIFTNAKVVSVS